MKLLEEALDLAYKSDLESKHEVACELADCLHRRYNFQRSKELVHGVLEEQPDEAIRRRIARILKIAKERPEEKLSNWSPLKVSRGEPRSIPATATSSVS